MRGYDRQRITDPDSFNPAEMMTRNHATQRQKKHGWQRHQTSSEETSTRRTPARTCDFQLNQRMCQVRNALNLLSRQRPTAYSGVEIDKISPGREAGEGNTHMMQMSLRLPHAKVLRCLVGGIAHAGRARPRRKQTKGDISATLDGGKDTAGLPLSHQAIQGTEG